MKYIWEADDVTRYIGLVLTYGKGERPLVIVGGTPMYLISIPNGAIEAVGRDTICEHLNRHNARPAAQAHWQSGKEWATV